MAISACPKCGDTMQDGFLLDGTYAGYWFARWMEGEPERSSWTGSVKVAERDCRRVTMRRCTGCGFLEAWAVEPAEPPSWTRQ